MYKTAENLSRLKDLINVKIPFISQTYTKAVAISFRQSHTRTRNLVKYHPRFVFTESFHAMVSTDEEVC